MSLRPSKLVYSTACFLFAVLFLCSQLAQRSAETSSLTNGFSLVPYDNTGHMIFENITACEGLWGCASTLCEMNNKFNNVYPLWSYLRIDINDGSTDSCSPEGFSWLKDWDFARWAMISLLVASILEVVSLVLWGLQYWVDKVTCRSGRYLFIACQVLSRAGLFVAYILFYVWNDHIQKLQGDYVPLFVSAWNLTLSVSLMIVSLLALVPKRQLRREYSSL